MSLKVGRCQQFANARCQSIRHRLEFSSSPASLRSSARRSTSTDSYCKLRPRATTPAYVNNDSSLPRRFKISVLSITYISYVCYHMTRKPIAVVKSVLHRNCSDLPRPSHFNELTVHDDDTWCDYAPFGKPLLALHAASLTDKLFAQMAQTHRLFSASSTRVFSSATPSPCSSRA